MLLACPTQLIQAFWGPDFDFALGHGAVGGTQHRAWWNEQDVIIKLRTQRFLWPSPFLTEAVDAAFF